MELEEVRNHLAMVLTANAYINICKSTDLVIAIDAIDKQIPKEPEWLYGFPYCPCGTAIDSMDIYCNKCGQKILWGNKYE